MAHAIDLREGLYTTRAMRRITGEPIPHEIQARILDAAVRAPSAGNIQTWRFLLVDDRRSCLSAHSGLRARVVHRPSRPIREPKESGPRTVGRLAQRYIDEHLPGLSTRFGDKQTYLLRRWVLPHLAERTVTAWTPAESVAVLAAARRADVSDATVQDIGSVMRALVTHARRLRWLTAQSENPMWKVRYARTATVQGNRRSHEQVRVGSPTWQRRR